MKCRNCSGDYLVNEEKCPYCGALNDENIKRSAEKKHRLDLLHFARLQTISDAGPVIVTKVLTRIILVFAALFIVLTAVGVFLSSDEFGTGKQLSAGDLEMHLSYLKRIKNSGDYDAVFVYLNKHHLSVYDEGFEAYGQLWDMYGYLIDFRKCRANIEKMKPEEIKEDSGVVEVMLMNACFLASRKDTEFLYGDKIKENEKIYDAFMEEVRVGLMLDCKLKSDEVDKLIEPTAEGRTNYESFYPIVTERMVNDADGK